MITKQLGENKGGGGGGVQGTTSALASEVCDLWVFHVTPPIRNASVNLNQAEVCHFQTDLVEEPSWSSAIFL